MMKMFFLKPYRFAIIISLILTCSLVFSILDTFVIPKALIKVSAVTNSSDSVPSYLKKYGITSSDIAGLTSSEISVLITSKVLENKGITSSDLAKMTSSERSALLSSMISDLSSSSKSTGNSSITNSNQSLTVTTSATENLSSNITEPIITDNSYQDNNIKITITTKRNSNTTYYVADITVSDASYLKTALANDTYGRNIKQKTSEMASAHNAIFAINGDFYGFRDTGYVVRNGVLYRNTPDTSKEALVIDQNGNLSTVSEGQVSAESLVSDGVQQVLSFGPALIKNSKIAVDNSSEVPGNEFTENPRTAIGQISKLHYVIIVSDGRTSVSSGLSFLDLAEEFKSLGCTVAYNLDGGGSSTMYFNGKVINVPTNGISVQERLVSDIVYFGYY